jgi:putative membrane protein
VLNALLLMLTATVLGDFAVSGFGSAVLGSLVISVVTMILGGTLKDGKQG